MSASELSEEERDQEMEIIRLAVQLTSQEGMSESKITAERDEVKVKI